MLVLFTSVFLALLFFGGQSAVILIAIHQGIDYAFQQHSGPRELQWQFRNIVYLVALAFCVLMIGSEIIFYLASR